MYVRVEGSAPRARYYHITADSTPASDATFRTSNDAMALRRRMCEVGPPFSRTTFSWTISEIGREYSDCSVANLRNGREVCAPPDFEFHFFDALNGRTIFKSVNGELSNSAKGGYNRGVIFFHKFGKWQG